MWNRFKSERRREVKELVTNPVFWVVVGIILFLIFVGLDLGPDTSGWYGTHGGYGG